MRPDAASWDVPARVVVASLGPDRAAVLIGASAMCADARSLRLMAEETAAAYGGLLPTASAPQYADLSEWQNRMLESSETEIGREFWRAIDRDAASGGRLPWDAPAAGGHFTCEPLAAPTACGSWSRLAGQADRYRVDPRSVLLAAWYTLLWRLGGASPVFVGWAVDGRDHESLHAAIGPLTHVVPVSQVLEPGLLFSDLCTRVARALGDAERWQHSFAWAPTGPSGDPYCRFLFEHHGECAPMSADLRWSLTDVYECAERSHVKLSSWIDAGELRLDVQFDAAQLQRRDVRRLVGCYRAVLDHVAARDSRIADIPIVSAAAERRWVGTGQGAVVAAEWRTVGEAFAAQAARTPDAVAVVSGAARLDFAGLDGEANAVAHALRARGVGPETRVGVYLPGGVRLAVALLGTLKAGGAYVPLDPAAPAARVAALAADAAVQVVVTDTAGAAAWPDRTAAVLCLDTLPAGARAAAPPPGAVEATHLAYVLYTSGSTGQPKGVMVEHGAVLNYLQWCVGAYAVASGTGSVVHTPVGFDLTVTSLWAPWLAGRAVVWAADTPGVAGLVAALRPDADYSLLKLTPAHLELLAAAAPPAAAGAARRLVVGGDALHAETLAFWRVHAPATRIINEYGPTEATVGCCVQEAAAAQTTGPVPIGRPIANTQLYVLDATGRVVPPGVAGELYIGGAGLARGYWGQPGGTAARFVPDPFSGRRGARLYRTGDQVRRGARGPLEYLGRRDAQVKLRGYRIELGEVEAALRRQPGVAGAAAAVHGGRLRGYVVAQTPPPADWPQTLRHALQAIVPDYLVPAAVQVLPALPLTPHGKLDRAALPVPPTAAPAPPGAPPRTVTEIQLAGIWAAVLGLDHVGIFDNFFALGGDSIMCLQVVARAKQANLPIRLEDVFRYETVARLAEALSAQEVPAGIPRTAPPLGGVAPTPIQQWFFDQRFEAPNHWNQAVLLETPAGDNDPSLWRQALQHLLAHHASLRLRRDATEHAWLRYDTAEPTVSFTCHDLSGLSAPDAETALAARIAEAQGSLDLDAGPVFCAAHFRADAARPGQLLLVAHHLAVDAVSWQILVQDLRTLYDQLGAGHACQLPPGASFAEWASALAHRAPGESDDQVRYWVDGAARPAGRFPIDADREPNLESSARVVSTSFSPELTRSLLDVPRSSPISVDDLLLAGLAAVVAQWTGTPSVRVDVERHGREWSVGVDVSRTVGWFTSLFPLSVELQKPDSPAAVLSDVREHLRDLPQNGFGYGLLRYGARAETARLPSPTAAPDVLFNYLGQLDGRLADGTRLRVAAVPAGTARRGVNHRTHLLEVRAYVAGGALHLDWTYSNARHRSDTIGRLAADYQRWLTAILEASRSSSEVGPRTGAARPAWTEPARVQQLLDGDPRIEDVYPLSPMQQAFVLQSVLAENTPAHSYQLSGKLAGSFDAAAFVANWRRAVEHHPVLRTGFDWRSGPEPLQIVRRSADWTCDRLDWRDLSEAGQEETLERYLAAELARRFDLTTPPLFRATLIRRAERVWHFVWTFHHAILDGWSASLLLDEVFALDPERQAPTAAASRPYRDYITWLARRDPAAPATFWRDYLAGFQPPPSSRTLHSPGPLTAAPDVRVKDSRVFDDETTRALVGLARVHHLTLNSVLLGMWGLVLADQAVAADIVVAAAFSGRQVELDGIDRMVGVFVSTAPVRIRVERDAAMGAWVARLQAAQAKVQRRSIAAPVDIQRWSGVPGTVLFDTVFAFENYPAPEFLRAPHAPFQVQDVRSSGTESHPLMLTVIPRPTLTVKVDWDRRRVPAGAGADLLDNIVLLVRHWLANPGTGVSGCLDLLAHASAGRQEARVRAYSDAKVSGLDRARRQPQTLPSTIADAPVTSSHG
jgi:amino acid adenylation domain-containing protein/non-ribosomal peptide synthase protein (TIGR01720 family)